jgi:hypothetical protein
MNLVGYNMGFEMFMEIRIYSAVVELKLIDLASQVMTYGHPRNGKRKN